MKKSNETIWSKPFLMLFLLTIFDQMAFLCTRAVISKYALDLGHTEAMAGVVAGALSVAALFSRPVAGRLLGSSRISKKENSDVFGRCLSFDFHKLYAGQEFCASRAGESL